MPKLRFTLAALVCFLPALGASKHVTLVPARCVSVDHFGKACTADHGGYNCDRVRISVKPDPECNPYNSLNVLEVNK